jgi:hypothetical protein
LINRKDLLQTEPRFGGKLMKRPPGPNFASVVEETTLTDKSALYAAIPIKTKK